MRKTLPKLIALAVSVVLALGGWLAWFALTPVEIAASPVDFSIRRGSGLRASTRQMIEAGIGMPAWQFNLLTRLASGETSIKAGSYQVRAGLTPWQLMKKITQGDFAQSEVVLIEGWTFRQVRAALDVHAAIRHDSTGLSDADIMRRLGADTLTPEGFFFPDTYLFGKGESDLAILARAHRAMQKRLQSAWQQRDSDTPLANPYEALILASIVEKETGQASERKLIAGVFVNRLRAGMLLQTDPTVIYGLGQKFDGNLRKHDLMRDHPFNTYTRPGLPPHPIAMPGQASLLAALNPAKTDALYFVARGDGTSQFSGSLVEHNRAVAKYQRAGR
ncbi:MAG: aminodeoxychorismate lyase [Betaproteobacteria bacterium RBG_16_64_18]|nr:MAG: aminodeoxychorismate lyase [Betaproteobacteria bacterium RBG_16_64_18]OGA08369.1 MAG: aminodeoxychorismate lyase [Betaproteobacteria bacterium RIFCSPLOWO2_02_FULL_65_20]OGA43018.1 MAG: aminodeoxychorismate lyase [Betaproteobacteria bacterium RIFCSPLOWO2_12_FULL_65_110]